MVQCGLSLDGYLAFYLGGAVAERLFYLEQILQAVYVDPLSRSLFMQSLFPVYEYRTCFFQFSDVSFVEASS